MLAINDDVLHYKCASEKVNQEKKKKKKMEKILTNNLKINKYNNPKRHFHGGRHI